MINNGSYIATNGGYYGIEETSQSDQFSDGTISIEALGGIEASSALSCTVLIVDQSWLEGQGDSQLNMEHGYQPTGLYWR